MDRETKNRLQQVLDRVKDPENGMSVSEMGLVAGIKYKQTERIFEVYLYPAQGAKACCLFLQMNAYSTMEQLLKKEMITEFPNHRVIFNRV